MTPAINPIPTEEEAVQAVPTTAEIQAAHLEKLDAWLVYLKADEASQEDRWSDYLVAIEHHANLSFQRDQANLFGSPIIALEKQS